MPAVTKILFLMSLLSFFGCRPATPVPDPLAQPVPDGQIRLESFYYTATHGYRGFTNRGYRAERLSDGKVRITVELGDDRDRLFVADASVMDSLEALVQEYRMNRYKERYKPMFDIKDGDTWDFSLKYSDGKRVRSGGYEAMPAGANEAFKKVEELFAPWRNMEPAEDTALVSFRYELHGEEGVEVFSFRKQADRNSVYFRESGSWEGWNYYCGDPQVLERLDKDMRAIHACSYCGEKLSEEDKSRPRWIAVLEYADGQVFELMDYLDRPDDDYRHRPPTNTEREIRLSAEHHFSKEIERIKNLPPEERGEHSRTTYKPDGTPSRTINYSGEGIVLGGHDYDDPMADF